MPPVRVAALITLLCASPALASAQDLDAARAAYDEGEAAAEALRWDDAEVAFRRSYALSNAPSAGFNAAMALRALGRHVAAVELLTELLARHGDWEHASVIAERLEEERARVATLHVEALEPPAATLRLDGRPLALPASGEVALDAGDHVLRAEADAHEPFETSLTLDFGERRSLAIRLAPLPPDVPVEAPGEDIAASPWLWLAVGAVVVAGVIVGAVLADDAMQLRPESPNVVRFP